MSSIKGNTSELYSYKGRKISKKISLSKKILISQFYDKFSLDHKIVKYHLNKNKKQKIKLTQNYKKINVELGFGDGEFLLKSAFSKPDELFIGVEVYINGIAKVLDSIIKYNIKNIMLSNISSFYFLDALPCNAVDKLFIINPDPWNKKRHNKRRLMSEKTLILLTKVIKSKNSIFLTTDSELYLRHTKKLLNNNKDLVREYQSCILQKNHELCGISRYQRKAIDKKGKIYLIIF